MFKIDHYVPILKTKAGELWAIRHLKPASLERLTPLLEFQPPPVRTKTRPEKSVTDDVKDVCKNIAKSLPNTKRFFLDTIHVVPAVGGAAALAEIFGIAKKAPLAFIPVVRVSYDSSAVNVLKAVINDCDGVAGVVAERSPQPGVARGSSPASPFASRSL